ncbi:hypothetical protein Poly30_51650 [Planctomycetes bacterium Poly30]|uniref:DUF5666 domain-containing protein n=1 Tax=Saltatorellus ferox TaxID=2528018 RepID=A0A518EZU5_9BACT|nr:hypothetical protein Poly30_51650 [Planctomycetes bacterium Poly30]
MTIKQLFSSILLLLIAACSGGISGSGGQPTGFSIGPIDGFGSVIVNGVRFESSSATFTKDGVASSQSEFRVGQVIELSGDFGSRVASSVTYRSEIKGPVTSVTVTDPTLGLGTLVVLGQTVRVNAQTVYDGTSLGSISTGNLLEVSGPRTADGSVVATYLEAKSLLPEYKVVGTATNATSTTFNIGGLSVNYSSADTSDLPGGVVNNGDRVEAKTDPAGFSAPSSFVANKVEPANGPSGQSGARLELEGYITNFAGPGDFRVLNFPVRTDSGTNFISGSAASLANNVKVQIKGSIAGDGVLRADSCEIQSSGAIRTEWEVESFDVGASTVTVLGVQWQIRSSTELEDDSSANVDPFTLADLNVGDLVQIRGFLDGTTPVASRFERDDPQSDARLRGPVTSVTIGGSFDFEILGTGIRSDGSTIHRDENDAVISQSAFFAALSEGVFVDAKWDPFSGTSGAADELSLEFDD